MTAGVKLLRKKNTRYVTKRLFPNHNCAYCREDRHTWIIGQLYSVEYLRGIILQIACEKKHTPRGYQLDN